ncbi:MAG: hypothetical protein AAGF47_12125, partial [Planctomycetota bacterium]
FQDGLQYGGFAAAQYRLSKDVSLGFGLAVRTRLEEDPFIIPTPSLDIQASDFVRIRVGAVDAGPGSPDVGMKIDYTVTDDLTIGGYAGVRFHQFRLAEDNNVVSAGIVEDLLVPIGASVEYKVNDNTRVVGSAIFTPHRELKLQDSDGDTIEDIELFPTLGVGVGLVFDF